MLATFRFNYSTWNDLERLLCPISLGNLGPLKPSKWNCLKNSGAFQQLSRYLKFFHVSFRLGLGLGCWCPSPDWETRGELLGRSSWTSRCPWVRQSLGHLTFPGTSGCPFPPPRGRKLHGRNGRKFFGSWKTQFRLEKEYLLYMTSKASFLGGLFHGRFFRGVSNILPAWLLFIYVYMGLIINV